MILICQQMMATMINKTQADFTAPESGKDALRAARKA